MKTFQIIIIILNSILLIHSLYYGFLAVLPFIFKRTDKKLNNKKNKFCILIAARNEELVLKPLIDSIKKQNYDKDKYFIYVIPNNCTDNTKKVALENDALILEPKGKIKTKGEVLNFAFNEFIDKDFFDAYVILDADNVLSKNFLKEMNNKLNEGYKIVQGFRDTKNLYQNAITGSYALFFYLQNIFLYESRRRIGKSSSINGTGYVVLKSYIDEIHYRAYTSTEDIELTCVSAIKKIPIGYQRKAIFYDEQVSNFNISMKQRKRWIQGSMQVWKLYKNDLFNQMIKGNNLQLTDSFFALTLPIVQAFALPLILLSYIFIIPFKLSLISILIAYFGEVFVAIFLTIIFKKKTLKMISAILFFPLFHLSWFPIYIYALFNSNNIWEEIKHTKIINIEDILDE